MHQNVSSQMLRVLPLQDKGLCSIICEKITASRPMNQHCYSYSWCLPPILVGLPKTPRDPLMRSWLGLSVCRKPPLAASG